MKFYSSLCLVKFSWDQVAAAFWSRYPNPYSTHVLTEDTVSQVTSGNRLLSKRLLTKTNSMPRWGERFVPGPRYVCVIEESIVDPVNKTLTTYTRNIGYTSLMMVEEKCVYRPSKDNNDWTECQREAWISSSIYGFAYALQAFGMERFKKNASRSLKGFNYVLNSLFPQQETIAQDKLQFQSNTDKLRSTAKAAKDLATAVVATN